MVAASERRRGIASALYEAMERTAEDFGRMVCEVNLTPPNPASLAFHRSRGYVAIGRREATPLKIVSMLSKELPVSLGHVHTS